MPRKPKYSVKQTDLQRKVFDSESGFLVPFGVKMNWFEGVKKYFLWSKIKIRK